MYCSSFNFTTVDDRFGIHFLVRNSWAKIMEPYLLKDVKRIAKVPKCIVLN